MVDCTKDEGRFHLSSRVIRLPSTRGTDLPILLHELNRAGLSFGAAIAESLGLTLSELAALEHVSSAGQLTPGELSRRLHLKSGSVTTLVDRLEQRKYLERHRHPGDRRKVLLRVTPTATEHIRSRIDAMIGEVQALAAHLNREQALYIAAFIREVTGILERHGAIPGQR